MRRWLCVCLLVAACAEDPAPRPTTARVDGSRVVLEGPQPLRGLELELAWDAGLTVSAITAGADAERLNLLRATIDADARTAHVLLTDTRKLHLPVRGDVLTLETTGSGGVRITSALGAGDAAEAIPVEVP